MAQPQVSLHDSALTYIEWDPQHAPSHDYKTPHHIDYPLKEYHADQNANQQSEKPNRQWYNPSSFVF